MKEYDVIIAGAGPAGSAAAIRLANLNPGEASRIVVLEKEVFPRPKLCGGGITRHADDLMRQLGVQLDVPSFPIHNARLTFEDLAFTIRWHDAFRIVRREEFDMALAREAEQRGVALCEGTTVLDVKPDAQGVTVVTDRGEYRGKVLIGADGANSIVRQRLGLVRSDRISRLLEILTPLDRGRSSEFVEHTAVFDFTPVLHGVQGYYWDFPSIKQGLPTMNRGVFDSRVRQDRPRGPLKPVLASELSARSLDLAQYNLKGHPERWFDGSQAHAAPRVLLAGDAAGADPLLGEGISHALNFGMLAADEVAEALAGGDFTFLNYGRRISRSGLGRRLAVKRIAAQIFYGPRSRPQYRLLWRLCRLVFGQ